MNLVLLFNKYTMAHKLEEEIIRLKEENQQLKFDLEWTRIEAAWLRWELLGEEAKECLFYCYCLLTGSKPTFIKWEDFKVDFVNYRSKKEAEKLLKEPR